MRKIIAIALTGLALAACETDPFEDKGGATAIQEVLVAGVGYGPEIGVAGAGGTYTVDGVTPSAAASGRFVSVITNGLLDGASIEAAPADVDGVGGCVPTGASVTDQNGWLDVTAPATHPADTATARWYTCYYPSSATPTDGGSVIIYWSATAPGRAAAARPGLGVMVEGTYRFQGSAPGADGDAIPFDVTVNVAPAAP